MSLPPDYDWSTFFFSAYADHEARPPDHDAADDEQFARSTGSRSDRKPGSRRPETMADWLDEQEDPGDDGWVVHHAMLAGSLTLFLGAPESFKSFGALWLARSALTGEDWLGRSVERFDRVYYAGNEKTRTSLKQRAKAIFGRPASHCHRTPAHASQSGPPVRQRQVAVVRRGGGRRRGHRPGDPGHPHLPREVRLR